MAKKLFETSIRYDKTLETGAVKTVTEKYLVEAITPTEAEARIIKMMTPYITGEFNVQSLKEEKFIDYLSVNANNDYVFYLVASFLTVDDAGKEKVQNQRYVIHADTFDCALNKFYKFMEDSVNDYTVLKLEQTKILDVFLTD